MTERRAGKHDRIDFDEFAGAEAEIESNFRRKIIGLRHMPRRDRPYFLHAAREAGKSDLRVLREKRAGARHARRLLRRAQVPTPR